MLVASRETAKREILSVRLDRSHRRQLEIAASVTGTTISGFLREAAADAARRVLLAELSNLTHREAGEDTTGSAHDSPE